jgi:hypothetical protein
MHHTSDLSTQSSQNNNTNNNNHLRSNHHNNKMKPYFTISGLPLSVFLFNNGIKLTMQHRQQTIEMQQKQIAKPQHKSVRMKRERSEQNVKEKKFISTTRYDMSSSLLDWKVSYYQQIYTNLHNNEHIYAIPENHNNIQKSRTKQSILDSNQQVMIRSITKLTTGPSSSKTTIAAQNLSHSVSQLERALYLLLQQQLSLKTLTTRHYEQLFSINPQKYAQFKRKQFKLNNSISQQQDQQQQQLLLLSPAQISFSTQGRFKKHGRSGFRSSNAMNDLLLQDSQCDGGVQLTLQQQKIVNNKKRQLLSYRRHNQSQKKLIPLPDTLFWVQLSKPQE